MSDKSKPIVVAADHLGLPLKNFVRDYLVSLGYQVDDLGVNENTPVDYPDVGLKLAEEVAAGKYDRAVLVCGSGAGAAVAANKFKGIRAATCHDIFSAHQCVEDDDCNVLCLGARVLGEELAVEIVDRYLGATFSGAERHRRRLAKVAAFEDRFGQ